MSRPRVGVAIPSWNGREHLRVCLEALRHQEDAGATWGTWVFDNGSRDGTREWLESEHPEVHCLRSEVNVGFARALDELVEAMEGVEAVVFLNNDTRPRPDWLASLVRALDRAPADVAAVAGRIVDWEGERLDFGRGLMTFDGHALQLDFRRPLEGARMPEEGEEVFFACGGNALVRRDVFRAVGGFDESFFAYYEDVDLGWRLWSAGHRILAAPRAVVHHRSGATSDLLGLFHRGFLFERNAFWTAYKNYDAEHLAAWLPAILWTFLHRTQTLLVQNNPRGELLTLDPYAGWIADTGRADRHGGPESEPVTLAAPSKVAARRGPVARLREMGVREAVRRLRRRLGLRLAGLDHATAPVLTDPRTVAQLRAATSILGGLEPVDAARRRVQAARQRADAEIFSRFPVYLVPTYPGDDRLFGDPGFRALLPATESWREAELAEILQL